MSLSARDHVLEVIEKYKSYPCLWQVKHLDYHNREKINAAMNALLELFKTKDPEANLDTVRKKITTLRNCFKKELNKVKASERSGTGTAEIHVPKLWYYSEMFFLADVDVPRVPRSVNSILDDMPFEDSAEISPVEIESLIRNHPGVYEVAVTGVPDPEHGDLPVAFVIRLGESKVTAQEIKDLVKNNLSDSKQLRGGVIFIKQLPLNASSKVDRKKLAALAKEMERE